MDVLPELPFEKMLSYLSLEDRLKARAVSRRWYEMINNFRVKTLCYSRCPSGFFLGKSRWVSGAFAQNFINSTRFVSFFNTFSHPILSNLKNLRICDLPVYAEGGLSTFISALNLFGQLEKLDIIHFAYPNSGSGLDGDLELKLPKLTSIHLEQVEGINQLTLDAPRLLKVKLLGCSSSLRLELVHADSVEWLATGAREHIAAKNLKNLRYLHSEHSPEIDATFLSSLEQLKEVHLQKPDSFMELLEQQQRYGRADLKIYLAGFLLNHSDDLSRPFNSISFFVLLTENPSRLADEIPLWTCLAYSLLDGVAPGSEVKLLSRFTDLSTVGATSSIPVHGIERFLNLLKNFPNIVCLMFSSDQPQDLFDRLPEHCDVQQLVIKCPVSDFHFLFRLRHLIALQYFDPMNADVVRKAFQELKFLTLLEFEHLNKRVSIVRSSLNRWAALIGEERTNVADLNAAIELIFGEVLPKKRKAEELE